ncbi:hypothetical protein [Vibrio parahaemolyticus]|uniref:hypothetical protein n=1 Tax=Vibrio parahaemolyticus TaxID=670 RepID=UPI002360D62F|nr:hypothetical protein [Vibrio parahaemolyticus]HCE2478819.1 hypothetical protein [Vibrio parahaemolyticus]
MLRLKYPSLYEHLLPKLEFGLHPVKLGDSEDYFLIVKCSKEIILTAELNNGFEIYSPLVNCDSVKTTSLLSVFYDCDDDPLTIMTFITDDCAYDKEVFKKVFSQEVIDIYFVSQSNIDILSFKSKIECSDTVFENLNLSNLIPRSYEAIPILNNALCNYFHEKIDEKDKVKISFIEPVTQNFTTIIDCSKITELHHVNDNGISISTLRIDEPGESQENEIAGFLNRVFEHSKIYMNPLKIDDREEISDLIVIGDDYIYFVQAKDSPNNESVIRNSIQRKKSTVKKHLKKAVNQMKGAIKHASINDNLEFFVKDADDTFIKVSTDIGVLEKRGIIVLKELFPEDMVDYTSLIIDMCKELKEECIVFDFNDLGNCTVNIDNEAVFAKMFESSFKQACQYGEFPKYRLVRSLLGD